MKMFVFKYADVRDIRRRMSVVAAAATEEEANKEFDNFIELLGGNRYRYCEPKETEVHTAKSEFYLFKERVS